MEKKLKPPGMYKTPTLESGIFTISTSAGFLPSTVQIEPFLGTRLFAESSLGRKKTLFFPVSKSLKRQGKKDGPKNIAMTFKLPGSFDDMKKAKKLVN